MPNAQTLIPNQTYNEYSEKVLQVYLPTSLRLTVENDRPNLVFKAHQGTQEIVALSYSLR
jgi:hypothetical protein